MKTRERDLARRIRKEEGAPIKEIARRVGVSAASVSSWVRDIQLSQDQHLALRARNPAYNRQLSGQAVAAANRRTRATANESG